MVELGTRILLSGALLFVAGAFGVFDFDVAWKVALATLALGGFANRLEARGLRNPGVAGFIAVADSVLVSILLASGRYLETFGVLVLAPCVWATREYRSDSRYTAPLAAAALLAAPSFSSHALPSTPLLLQVVAILALGLLLGRGPEPVFVPKASSSEPAVALNALTLPDDEVLLVRESYRKLRDAFTVLEARAKKDRVPAILSELDRGAGDAAFARLCDQLAEWSGARSVVLHTVAGYGSAMVVRGTTSKVPDAVRTESLDIDLRGSTAILQHQAAKAIQALGLTGENVLLSQHGRPVGLITVSHDSPEALDRAVNALTEAADAISGFVVDVDERQDARRRLKESDLLYSLATLAEGSESRTQLAARFVTDLAGMMEADHLSTWILEDNTATCLARRGIDCRIFEEFSFAEGAGIPGWIAVGTPELAMHDLRADMRCPSGLALKSRLGSLLLIPFGDAAHPEGFVLAATSRAGGLDLGHAETLRAAAAELGRAMGRFERAPGPGIVSVAEISRLAAAANGVLVQIETLRWETLTHRFGPTALAHAQRRFIRQVRAKLPAGGAICARPDGQALAYLPNTTPEYGSVWANEVAASASLIGLRTPDGAHRIPYAIRAKVADLNRQEDQVFEAQRA